MATKEELRLRARRFSRNVLSSIREWWDGEFLPFYNSGDNVFVIGGTTHRHWTANAVRSVVGFLRSEWRWAIPVVIMTTGLLLQL